MTLPAAISAYADRLHRAIGAEHHVASPLGAWLVLALAAPAMADEDARGRLAAILAMPLPAAAAAAHELLEQPHEAVHLAAAAWVSANGPAVKAWVAQLPEVVETGPIPSQAEADAWVRRNTLDLISEFPLDVTDVGLVLGSAIGCAIGWSTPFLAVSADELTLPTATGFDRTVNVLKTQPEPGVSHLIVATDDGTMAVHAAGSADHDMVVVSVIADPAVPAATVLKHAHAVATEFAGDGLVRSRRSLFDLPLGADHSWTISESIEVALPRTQRFESLLPAWSAGSKHDLMALPDIGFDLTGEGLRHLVSGLDPEAAQSAVAQYTREGFKAAAVTAVAIPVSMPPKPTECPVRTARLEYSHPYGVVAVSTARRGSPWAALPLFSAWITKADEA